MSKENIIIEIFYKSFADYPQIISNSKKLLEIKIKKLRIDIQDISLIETMTKEDLNNTIDKIRNDNMQLCVQIKDSNSDNSHLYKELVDNFFNEINNTIDFIYNLIISKQLGG